MLEKGAHSPVNEGILLLVAAPSQPLTGHAPVLFLWPLQLTGRKVMFLSLFLHSQGAECKIILCLGVWALLALPQRHVGTDTKPFSGAEPLLYRLLLTLSLLIAASMSPLAGYHVQPAKCCYFLWMSGLSRQAIPNLKQFQALQECVCPAAA